MSWGGSLNGCNISQDRKNARSPGKFASSGVNSRYNTSIVPEEVQEVVMSTTQTPTTADELFLMPADCFRYELVKGQLRRMPPAGSEHGAGITNIGTPID